MKSKGFLILIGILLILCTVFYFLYKRSEGKTVTIDKQEVFLGNVNIGDIKEIIIDNGKNSLSFIEHKGQWVSKNKDYYPVQFKKLLELISSIKEIGFAQKKTKNESYYAELGVQDPSANTKDSILVLCKGKNEEVIVGVIFGKKRKSKMGPGGTGVVPDAGQYIRKYDDSQVYYIKNSINVDSEIKNWLDKIIIDLKDEEVQKVVISGVDKKEDIIVQRENKDNDFAFSGEMPKGKKIKNNELKRVIDGLRYLNLEDVYSTDNEHVKDLVYDSSYTVLTFEGIKYQANISKDKEKNYLKVIAELDREEADEEEDSFEELKRKVNDFNQKISSWVYVIPVYKAETLMRRVEDIIEDEIREEKDKEKTKGTKEKNKGKNKGKQ